MTTRDHAALLAKRFHRLLVLHVSDEQVAKDADAELRLEEITQRMRGLATQFSYDLENDKPLRSP